MTGSMGYLAASKPTWASAAWRSPGGRLAGSPGVGVSGRISFLIADEPTEGLTRPPPGISWRRSSGATSHTVSSSSPTGRISARRTRASQPAGGWRSARPGRAWGRSSDENELRVGPASGGRCHRAPQERLSGSGAPLPVGRRGQRGGGGRPVLQLADTKLRGLARYGCTSMTDRPLGFSQLGRWNERNAYLNAQRGGLVTSVRKVNDDARPQAGVGPAPVHPGELDEECELVHEEPNRHPPRPVRIHLTLTDRQGCSLCVAQAQARPGSRDIAVRGGGIVDPQVPPGPHPSGDLPSARELKGPKPGEIEVRPTCTPGGERP